MKIIIIFFYLLLGLANIPALARPDFTLRNITLPQGYYGIYASKAAIDNAGMLWIVTNSGLFRFDGLEMVQYENIPGFTFSQSTITCMLADQNQGLWIGTTTGLVRINLRSWKATVMQNPTSYPDGLPVNAVLQTKEGVLVAGTKDGLLLQVSNNKLLPLLDVKEKTSSTPQNAVINILLQTGPGKLAAITGGGFLVTYDLKTKDSKMTKIPGGEGSGIALGAAGFDNRFRKLYLTVSKGSNFELQFTTEGITCHKTDLLQYPARLYYTDRVTGNLFAVVSKPQKPNYLYLFDVTENKELAVLPADTRLTGAMYASQGQAILSYGSGIAMIARHNPLFRTFRDDIAPAGSIRAILPRAGNSLLVSCYKAGLNLYNPTEGSNRKIPDAYPYTFLSWNQDSVLIGNEGGGVQWLDRKNKAVRLGTWYRADSTIINNVTSLKKENDSQVWIGSYQGLILADIYHRKSRYLPQGRYERILSSARIYDIADLDRETRIIATDKGIFTLNVVTKSVLPFAEAGSVLSSKFCYCLYIDNDYVYAGSNGSGLLKFDRKGKLLQQLDLKSGLIGNAVFALTAYKGYLLAGTDRGMSVIPPKKGHISNYTTYDGMPANEINHSSFFRVDSLLYAGTITGMMSCNIEELMRNRRSKQPAPFFIATLIIEHGGQLITDYTLPYRNAAQIEIPAGCPVFSLLIGTGINDQRYSNYYYRLSADEHWHEIGKNQNISFVNMAPGNYNLQLAARTVNGEWLYNLYNTQMLIKPLWYQVLAVRIAGALLLIAAVVLIVWLIIRTKERQQEKEKLLRLKIAGDLHDEVGGVLTGMSMQADFLLMGNKEKEQEYLEQIASSGRSAIHTISDIVWSIDPRNDDNTSLLDRMKYYARKTLEPTNIQLTISITGEQENMFVSQAERQNIMLIFKEILTNICKHAEATKVDIAIVQREKELNITVTDNGIGFRGNLKGNGLLNMETRAALLHGNIIFRDNSPARGTEVKVCIPLNKGQKQDHP